MHSVMKSPPRRDDFELVDLIGEGSFAKVFKAQHKKSDTEYAIKVIDIDNSSAHTHTHSNTHIDEELKFLSRLKSPWIVSFFGSYRHSGQVWIVLEYMSGGSMTDIMTLSRRPLTEEQAKHVTTFCVLALQHIHSKNCIHRDVKPGNLLLSAAGVIKLCDFGDSVDLASGPKRRNSIHGTAQYVSPEMAEEKEYDERTDVWSLGITVLELCEGQAPNEKMHPRRCMALTAERDPPRLHFESEWSKSLSRFLCKSLVKDPTLRASAVDLLEHEWVRSCVNQIRRVGRSEVAMEMYAMRSVWEEEARDLAAAQAEIALLEKAREEARIQLEIDEEERLEKLRVEEERVRWEEEQQRRKEVEALEARKKEEQIRKRMKETELAEEERTREAMRQEEELSVLSNQRFRIERIKCSGWLLKKSAYLGAWNPRFFVLDEGVVRYYESDQQADEVTPRGVYVMTPATRVISEGSDDRYLGEDYLCVEDSSNKPWTLVVRCSCHEESQDWARHFENHAACAAGKGQLNQFQLERARSIYKEGWLQKQSEYLQTFNRRFFVLDKGVLRYYDGDGVDDRVAERGKYVFTPATKIVPEDTIDISVPRHCIYIHDTEKSWSIMVFCGSNENKFTWTNYLNQHVKFALAIQECT
mmetsp:Transcript_21399/g.30992  ORF Transcript_21399/g.30992 Transcript_21399/m.30992 type:complete len:641 (+) Transcript_21399:101-2023(+)